MYTLKFKDKTQQVSGLVFFVIIIPIIPVIMALVGWFGYMVYQSTMMLEYYTHIPAFVAGLIAAICLVTVNVDINGVKSKKAILPAFARNFLGFVLTLATFHYIYSVKEWSLSETVMLASPILLVLVGKLLKK